MPVEKPADQPKKAKSLMDDDEIFHEISKPAETKPPIPSSGSFDSGLGGFSFEPTVTSAPQPRPANNDDPFNILGLEMPSTAPQKPPQPQQPPSFGGDLLGFGSS